MVTKDQESDHNLQVFKHGLMQFFRSSLVLQKQGDDSGDLPEELLHLWVRRGQLLDGCILLFTRPELQHAIDFNSVLHVKDERPDGTRLHLRCVAGEANQEHLEELGNRFEASQNLGHLREGFLCSSANLLVRIADSRYKLHDK